MNENLIEAQIDVTKKNKLRKIYENNRILIYSIIFIILISFSSLVFYSSLSKKEDIKIGNSYIEARIFLQKGETEKAKEKLKELIYSDHSTYSTLSLFLFLNENVDSERSEKLSMFDHVLNNNSFDNEIKNLLIYKKALFQSNFVNEAELLQITNPLINSDSVWKPHALLLIGDYFLAKKEYVKAREFYTKLLSLKDLDEEIFKQGKSQFMSINE